MKYIVHPFIVLLLVIAFLIAGLVRMGVWLLWNFRIPSFRKAYTFDGEYCFDNWSWKKFFKMFIYDEEFYL